MPSNITLSRETRRLVLRAITTHPSWEAWRAANLGEKTSADMLKADIVKAAADLGVDIMANVNPGNVPTDPQALADDTVAIIEMVREIGEATPEALPETAPDNGARAPGFEGVDPETLVLAALNPAADMLGTRVLNLLQDSLRPLAVAASQGPRVETKVETREVVRTVTVDATGAVVAAPTAPVSLVELREARAVFRPLKSKARGTVGHLPIPVCNGIAGEGDCPTHDPLFIWNPDVLSYLCLVASMAASNDSAKRKRASALLYGPAGTGKTSAAECFAAACGRPFFRIAFDRTTEPLELTGQRLPVAGGGTAFHAGAVVNAMQVPFAVILLDEPSFLRPGSAAVLQTIMDKRYIYLKEDNNRRVDCAEGVMFLAADNTNLTGDETGRYADTNSQNIALQDRFGYLVPCNYLTPEVEAQALSSHTSLPLDASHLMVKFATRTRNGAVNGQLTTGTSYRRLLAWADAVVAGMNSRDAFEASIYNPCDPADRQTIQSLASAEIKHADVDALARGGTVAAAPSHDAVVSEAGARAAGAFGEVPLDAS